MPPGVQTVNHGPSTGMEFEEHLRAGTLQPEKIAAESLDKQGRRIWLECGAGRQTGRNSRFSGSFPELCRLRMAKEQFLELSQERCFCG